MAHKESIRLAESKLNVLFNLKPNRKHMTEYKVESLIYYSKVTLDVNHIAKRSKEEIQQKLDEYSAKGYKLTSTTSTNFGLAIYIYLFFERS